MLTEAEAKTKWCPMSRPVFPRVEDCGYQSGNRDYQDPATAFVPQPQTNCVGSACMMWRTGPVIPDRYFVTYKEGATEEEWDWNPTGHKDYQDAKVRVVSGNAQGFCGLAGEPHR